MYFNFDLLTFDMKPDCEHCPENTTSNTTLNATSFCDKCSAEFALAEMEKQMRKILAFSSLSKVSKKRIYKLFNQIESEVKNG